MITNMHVAPAIAPRSSSGHSAVHLVRSSQLAMRFASVLLTGLVVSALAMLLLPWQQTSRGTGQIIAYVPQERQQSIQSPIKGVVVKVAEGILEGTEVKEGDLLLEVEPVASNLREQMEAQKRDLIAKLDSANVKAEAYGQNVQGFIEARDFAVQAAAEMVESAKAKLDGKRKMVVAYEAKELQTRLNFERQNKLYEAGIKPAREVEMLNKDWDVTRAELNSILQDVESLDMELSAKENELEEKRRVAQTKIDYSRAMQQDAIGGAATIRKEMREIEIQLAELQRLKITAPRNGTIFRMPLYERGQIIREGEAIATIIPETSQIAVELSIRGNDMPLVERGQEVRLQFEGWPAVQFAGWPSVAVGTFSGTVANVDATDDGKGQFRILITPRKSESDWPSERYLRQGVRANGWIMLRRVSLGYEIWRQLNGFPVIISDEEPLEKKSTPKLPK